jgi:enoyl-CoA hydratase/carnithine racemase
MSAVERLQETTRILLGMDKPVIAAIHGYALGAGCEWAMNCDIRIAAEGTQFGFPETSLGSTLTNASTKLLPLIVGLGRAKELVFTNRIIDAKEAKEWGLVNEVVPLDSLEEVTLHMAEKMAGHPRFGMSLAKAALHLGCCGDLSEVLEREAKDAVLSAQNNREFLSKTKE